MNALLDEARTRELDSRLEKLLGDIRAYIREYKTGSPSMVSWIILQKRIALLRRDYRAVRDSYIAGAR